jgi:hypothetical protein
VKKFGKIHKYRLTEHAKNQMNRRRINDTVIDSVLKDPQQIIETRSNRLVYQSIIDFGKDRNYLVRVFVDIHSDPPEVVTCYRTSKIEKYRR